MDNKPLFTYTCNFFLTLDMSRPNFRAQAFYMVEAVEAEATLPAVIRAEAGVVKTAATAFNEKVVRSTMAAPAEPFGAVRGEADRLLRLQLKRFVGPRYPDARSADYQRFLPDGLAEYNDADETTYQTIFERFVRAMESETRPFQDPDAAAGDAKPAQQARAMLTRLEGATKAGDQRDTEQNQLRLALTADWRTLAEAQWQVWLSLCKHFAGHPDYRERIYAFVDFGQLQRRSVASEEPAPTV